MSSINYANLVMGADTRGLLKGRDALEATTRAGAKTEKAVSGTEKGFVRAGRGAGAAAKQVEGFNKSADRTRGVAASATRVLGGMAAAFLSANALGRASQAYAEIGNSMRAMGVDADSVAGQIQAIGDIAKRTRAPLEGTAQLYQRVSVAGKDLGASQQQVMRFTENVGLALAQQGGGAAAASGALLQLSQAMSGGVVRAEEFNSILEGAYPIAQAAANAIDGASGSVGKLRNMVIEGEISSREFFEAILSSTAALEAAFGNTVPTISQAMSVMSTSFTLFIGELDSALGVSAALAEGIIFLAENIDRIAIYAATAAAVFGGAYVAGAALAAAKTLTFAGALRVLRAALIRTGIGALVVGAGELIYRFTELARKTGGVGNAMAALGDLAVEVWGRIGDGTEFVTQSVAAMASSMSAVFLQGLNNMVGAFMEFTWAVAEGLNSLFDLDLKGAKIGHITADLNIMATSAEDAASKSSAAANEAASAFTAPLTSMQTLKDAVVDTETAGSELNKTLSDTGEAGKKAAKGAAAAAREIENIKKAYDSLIGSLDPAVAASQEFAAAQKAVNDALKIGYITSGEAANAMGLAKERMNEAMKEASAATGVWEGFEDSARSAFGSVITGAESAKDAIAKLLSSLAGKFADSAFDGLFGGINWGGGGSKGGLFGGSIIPGILHDGGIAGKDGYGHGRAFAAANFDNAPRYHNGGIAGLKPNEVPAILERGERVIPKGQSGGDGGTSFTYAPQIDARGADAGAVQRLEAAMARAHAEFEDRAINAFNMGKKRRKIV